MKKFHGKIFYFVFTILFGAFTFLYGEFDDSPGGQLIGLAAVIIGIIGSMRSLRAASRMGRTNKKS